MDILIKIYYFNDEESSVFIQVNNLGLDNVEHYTLKPQEGKLFTILAPEGAISYIKKWNRLSNKVLLTYLPADSITQFEKIL